MNTPEHASPITAQSLGLRLQTLRERRHLKQRAVAKQIFVSPQSYSAYEKGKRLPNILILVRLSRFYRISLDYLVTGESFCVQRD